MDKLQYINSTQYDSKGAMRYALGKLLAKTDAIGEYNLYLHKIYNMNEYGKNFNNMNSVRNNMKSIFRSGLSINKYSSILQTSCYYGLGLADKVDTITEYDYPWFVPEQAILILALPKTMLINGEQIDFSTPKYKFREGAPHYGEMLGEKSQYVHAFDQCDLREIPSEFILGSIITNLPDQSEEDFLAGGNKYELYINTNHFSQMSNDKQEEVLDPIRDKIVRNNGIVQGDTKEQIDAKITTGIENKDKDEYNNYTYASDWDFD